MSEQYLKKVPRPKITPGTTTRVRMVCGNLYVTVNRFEGRMFEVFATLGKSGGCAATEMQSLTTTVTLSIRCGVDPEVHIGNLSGAHCPSVSFDEGVKYLSCPDAIAQVMRIELDRINSGFYIEADERFEQWMKEHQKGKEEIDKKEETNVEKDNPDELPGREES